MLAKSSLRSNCRAARLSAAAFASLVAVVQMTSLPVRADDWTPLWTTATLSQPRAELAATAIGTKVLFAGGACSGYPFSNVVDIYDTVTETWSTATLSVARVELAAASADGKALFAGGWANSVYYNTVDIYDSTTNTWSTATLSQAREYIAATSSGDNVFFGGGSGYSNAVDIYNAASNTWSTASLSQPRSDLAATSAGGKVLFGGGDQGYPSPSKVVDIYDTSTGSWSTTTLSQASESLAAASADGKVLFAGGGTNYYTMSDLSTVNIYDTSTNTWSTAALSQARQHLAATSVGNKVLFAGGSNASNVVDIYDAGTGQWSTASLSVGRDYLTATSLGNQAFFAGGTTATGSFSNVVDIYTLQDYPFITSTRTFTLVDNTTVTGLMQLNGGSLALSAYNLTIGSMSGAAPIDLGTSTLTTGTDNTSTTYSGAVGGSGRLTKTGTGSLVLAASNTYTGPTTISQGKLTIDGTLTNSAVSVNGGTLGGTGSLRSVTVNSSGVLAPGDPLGVLHLSGNLVLSASATMDFDLDGVSTDDEVSMPSGSLTLNGQQFSNFGFNWTGGFGPGTYTLVNAESITGLGSNLSGSIDGLPASLSVQNNDLMLTVVPEPSTAALFGAQRCGAARLGVLAEAACSAGCFEGNSDHPVLSDMFLAHEGNTAGRHAFSSPQRRPDSSRQRNPASHNPQQHNSGESRFSLSASGAQYEDSQRESGTAHRSLAGSGFPWVFPWLGCCALLE